MAALSKPITMTMIQQACGVSGDLGHVITTGIQNGTVNKWSARKPIVLMDDSINHFSEMTDAIQQYSNYGFDVDSILVDEDDLEVTLNYGWEYLCPRGVSDGITEPFRMLDFVGYNPDAVKPCSSHPSERVPYRADGTTHVYVHLHEGNDIQIELMDLIKSIGDYVQEDVTDLDLYFGAKTNKGSGVQWDEDDLVPLYSKVNGSWVLNTDVSVPVRYARSSESNDTNYVIALVLLKQTEDASHEWYQVGDSCISLPGTFNTIYMKGEHEDVVYISGLTYYPIREGSEFITRMHIGFRVNNTKSSSISVNELTYCVGRKEAATITSQRTIYGVFYLDDDSEDKVYPLSSNIPSGGSAYFSIEINFSDEYSDYEVANGKCYMGMDLHYTLGSQSRTLEILPQSDNWDEWQTTDNFQTNIGTA